jgi:hypothetical protein
MINEHIKKKKHVIYNGIYIGVQKKLKYDLYYFIIILENINK